MKDLSEVSLNIGSLQAHYSSGSLTPGDVIREVYRRIRTLPDNPVWIHLVPEEEAVWAAEALHGTASHPLFGIPFAIKDNIDAANLPTTAGCPAFSYVAEKDATTVERLKKGWRNPHWQNEPRSVCHWPGWRAFALRSMLKCLSSRVHLGRLQLRLCSGSRSGTGEFCFGY